MIPRYQKILFTILLLASAGMGAELWHLRQRAHQRLLAGQVTAPTKAPEVAPLEQATLMVADDRDDSLQTRVLSLPLPPNTEERAKMVLDRLLELYAAQGSSHPVPGETKPILQIFLVPAAAATTEQARASASSSAAASAGPELAVVNLSSTFVAHHPSGIETETLTLLSICATLRANLPRVTEVRFLVDGETRPTLAGHADLTRTYLTSDLDQTQGAPS